MNNTVIIHRSRTPSPKRRVVEEFHRQNAISLGNRLISGGVTGLDQHVNPLEDPDDLGMPRTSMAIIFGVVIAASVVIAIYLMAIVAHEYHVNQDVSKRIGGLQDRQELIAYNLTVIADVLHETGENLQGIERDVNELQANLTSLAQRIADINCTGIRRFNLEIEAADEYGHGGGNAWIMSGLPAFITVSTNGTTITVNGTLFQLLIDAQEESLGLLQSLLSAVNAALAMLTEQTLMKINGAGALGNNIDFVGPCNVSITQGNGTVIIDGCSIRDEIDRQFQMVYAQFLAALQKIAQLKASIAYIEAQIIYIEQVIADVMARGLMTINGVGPGPGGAFTVSSADAYLNITTGPASNEILITNEALINMNNVSSDASNSSTFYVRPGGGVGIVNNDDDGTVTISNLAAAIPCQIRQRAFSRTSTVSNGFVGFFPVNFQFFDTNFDPALTVATPPGCAGDTTQYFKRIAVADPDVYLVNTVCKPPGRWILQVSFQGSIRPYGVRNYLSVVWGLGSAGDVPPKYTIGGVNRLFQGSGDVLGVFLGSQYTITSEAPWCYNVTWITGTDLVANADMQSTWIMTRIN
jgi:hypothetical protein